MKVQSISISGMHKITFQKNYCFDNANYFAGPNGSGKSTVLEAIQLAVLGYVPGYGKRNEDIFKHCNSDKMSVTIVLCDNSFTKEVGMITRSWIKSGNKIVSDVSTYLENLDISEMIRDIELPVFNFNEFLGLTANKMKDWFIQFLPKECAEVDWKYTLNKCCSDNNLCIPYEDMQSTLDGVLEACRGFSGVEAVRKVNEFFKSQISLKKAESSRLQATIQSLVYYADTSTGSTVAMKAELDNLRKLYEQSIRDSQYENHRNILRERLDMLHCTSDCLESDPKYIQLKAQSDAISKKIEYIDIRLYALNDKVSVSRLRASQLKNVANGHSVCSYTDQPCEAAAKSIDTAKEALKNLEASISSATSSIDELKNAKSACAKSLSDIYSELDTITKEYSARESIMAELSQVCSTIQYEDPEFYKQQIDTITDKIIRVEANNKYTQMYDSLTKDMYSIQNLIELFKACEKLTGANGMQTAMMTEPFVKMSQKVDVYLSKFFNSDVRCYFNLSEKANSFSFGLSREGKYIPYDLLSSGEKCMFALSLIICMLSTSSCKLKTLLIDDMLDHVDDDNVINVFNSLCNVDNIQVIAAGVKNCSSSNMAKFIKEI